MRIAAIDVGTNSIHLEVAEISPDGVVSIVERQRVQAELGAGGLGQNRITDEAFARGLAAMARFKAAADGLGAEAINAAATSAVREASNGSEFVHAVREQTGIHIRVISGLEEARLVYLGARGDLDFNAGRVLLMDLGGGSVEFVLCDAKELLTAVSLPLGHIRMADAFHLSDPISKDEVRRLRAHVRQTLSPLIAKVGPEDFATLVGTSGAVRTLGRMATLLRGESLPERGHGIVARRADLDTLIRQFGSRRSSRYAELPGMDVRRSRTLPVAAVFVREVLGVLGCESVQTSDRSLRDGLVVEWALEHRPELELSRTVQNPRLRAVRATMERYGADVRHAEVVTGLALTLFDATAGIHQLDARARRTLEYAALLHDVGHHVSGEDHHKHGAYLIRHTRMHGFTAPEIAVLSNIVRYHRGSGPKRQHEAFEALPRDDQRAVRILSGMLQIADALDRSHTQTVRRLDVEVSDERVSLLAWAREEAHIERWAVERRLGILGDALGRPVRASVRRAEGPADPSQGPVDRAVS